MRRLYVAGNWKMNLNGRQAVELAEALKQQIGAVADVRLAVCPPFVYVRSVADVLEGSKIIVGGQNIFDRADGAYTGEISGAMLLDAGCRCVILGHSERRHVIGEPDEFINRKVRRALEVGLEPILCVGETLDEREAGRTEEVVASQFRAGLAGVSAAQMPTVTIAYEPVWAIGTGKTATPQQAEEVHAVLRGLLADSYGAEVSEETVVQYGGSVKPENAAELMSMPNVDGALVGGASLKADAFVGIVRAAGTVKK
jgi:triosephosphate isomerase